MFLQGIKLSAVLFPAYIAGVGVRLCQSWIKGGRLNKLELSHRLSLIRENAGQTLWRTMLLRMRLCWFCLVLLATNQSTTRSPIVSRFFVACTGCESAWVFAVSLSVVCGILSVWRFGFVFYRVALACSWRSQDCCRLRFLYKLHQNYYFCLMTTFCAKISTKTNVD